MKQVVFKNYLGVSKYGKPVVCEVDNFDTADLLEMLNQPLHLEKVSFQIGHQVWVEHWSNLFDQENGGVKAAEFSNLGFAKGLATLGYRIVPEPHEIEIS
jgi:hypothetical protein